MYSKMKTGIALCIGGGKGYTHTLTRTCTHTHVGVVNYCNDYTVVYPMMYYASVLCVLQYPEVVTSGT